MNARQIKRRSTCPISYGLDIFGDKWTLLIVRDIMFYHRTRFSDFAPQEHIATNILTDRLSRLESAGIITKQRDEKLKNQYIYSVTEKGKNLLPILVDMTLWGLQYDDETPASEEFVDRINSERSQLTHDITKSIKSDQFTEYRLNHMGIGSQ